jgi:hypothetical protein
MMVEKHAHSIWLSDQASILCKYYPDNLPSNQALNHKHSWSCQTLIILSVIVKYLEYSLSFQSS